MAEKTVTLRPYRVSDLEQLAQLFFDTIHTVNARDYTPVQLDAWADGKPDLECWNHSFLNHCTLVAVSEETIVGFGDLDDTGYLDRLYVHRDWQGRGIATVLCDALETHGDHARITTHASITARPFFERRGYQVVREQRVERHGILLTNFVMTKERRKLP